MKQLGIIFAILMTCFSCIGCGAESSPEESVGQTMDAILGLLEEEKHDVIWTKYEVSYDSNEPPRDNDERRIVFDKYIAPYLADAIQAAKRMKISIRETPTKLVARFGDTNAADPFPLWFEKKAEWDNWKLASTGLEP